MKEKDLTYSDYKSLYKSLKAKKAGYRKKIKIALLSSFTIQGLDEILYVKCAEFGIVPDIYLAPYNQYSQEIFDPKSKLHKFNPDLVILMIDPIGFFGDYWLNPYQHTAPKRKRFIKNKFEEIKELVFKLRSSSKIKIIIHNFNLPHHSPLGILENKQEFSFKESVQSINLNMTKMAAGDPNLFVFDYDSFCAKHGSSLDFKMYYLADMRLPLDYLPRLCDEYVGYIKPLVSIIKKCLVLDLDNTLWGGILGEAGIEGIELGPTPQGRSFWEFQKYILSFYERGILLAVNSRNNKDEVLKVLKEHPYMILKEEHFSVIEANWQDKVTNMKSIAKQLNIGLDSLVFFDDDPYQRELVRKNLKDVSVINLPEDKSLYLDTLMNLNDFNTLQITDEDKVRTKLYILEQKRQKLQESVSNIDEFVESLKVVVKIEKANEFSIPRISQLTQKTNQFNMTTRRYLEDDIKSFNQDSSFLVLSVKVSDKFGDYGLTGVVIVEKNNGWKIDTFLLSCRVLGRKVENTILEYLVKEAGKNKVISLTGEFIKTDKNNPAQNFYRDNKFKLVKKTGSVEQWVLEC